MKFNFWNDEDLKKIAIGGQNVLNVGFDRKTLSFLAKESVGCPLLMQLFSLIACYASNVIERQRFPVDVKIDEEQFKTPMRNYGNMFLSPCEDIWNMIVRKNEKMKNSNDNFINEIISFIKSEEFKLECSFNEVFKNTDHSYIKKIIRAFNNHLLTTDFMAFNPENDLISFSKPLVLVYIRWMLD